MAYLAAKVQNGTATGEDFADVSCKSASTLSGFVVLTGLAAPWTLVAAVPAGKIFGRGKTVKSLWTTVKKS